MTEKAIRQIELGGHFIMMRALYSGVSGLKTHQTKMDVIGNNIANVNTAGFKSSSSVFSEIMYQNLSGASGATATKGGVNAKQIGLGVSMGSTSVNITSPGAPQTTGDGWDLRITGDSFFIVNNGTENLFTKAGAFYVDGAGYLSTKATGYNVMGWRVDPTTGDIRKDVVSRLPIMVPENQTSNPEATTEAFCAGVLDDNNTQVNSDAGYTMNLNFYDSLGYNYSAKFAVKTVNSDTKTYTIELTDILDSRNHSILQDYLAVEGNTMTNVFGEPTTVDRSYNLAADFTYRNNTFYDVDGNALVYDADNLKYVAEGTGKEYAVSSMFGVSEAQVQQYYDPATAVTANGESAIFGYSETLYGYTLDFNEGEPNAGQFNFVGQEGVESVMLKMSALGTEFSNINVDFTGTKNFNNGGQNTIELKKGMVDAKEQGTGRSLGTLIGLQVQEDGRIFASYDNGNTELLGQIAVAVFPNPSGLEKVGDNCYRTTLNSGEFDGIGRDITADNGKMTSGVLEMSNVDLATEFTEMITTQRGFQANSKIITTSDTLLEELVNLKR